MACLERLQGVSLKNMATQFGFASEQTTRILEQCPLDRPK